VAVELRCTPWPGRGTAGVSWRSLLSQCETDGRYERRDDREKKGTSCKATVSEGTLVVGMQMTIEVPFRSSHEMRGLRLPASQRRLPCRRAASPLIPYPIIAPARGTPRCSCLLLSELLCPVRASACSSVLAHGLGRQSATSRFVSSGRRHGWAPAPVRQVTPCPAWKAPVSANCTALRLQCAPCHKITNSWSRFCAISPRIFCSCRDTQRLRTVHSSVKAFVWAGTDARFAPDVSVPQRRDMARQACVASS